MGTVAGTQEAQKQGTFRTGVDLVTIDVTVVDRSGIPVKGLGPGDFVVTLEGQRRPVEFLHFLEFGGPAIPAFPASQTSNQSATASRMSQGGRIIVLLVDDLSMRPSEAKGLTAAVGRMLPLLDTGDLVGITTTSGLGPSVNPTRDRAVVIAALRSKDIAGRRENVTAPFFVTVPEALDILRGRRGTGAVSSRECAILFPGADEQCRQLVQSAARRLAFATMHQTAMQLASYTAAMEALRSAPTPRILIALSKGLATGEALGYEPLDVVSRVAAEAGVQFYALTEVADLTDVVDQTSGCKPPCVDRPAARRYEGDYLTAGIQTLAAAAGGEAFKVIGQADRFFGRILNETASLYRLGVNAPELAKPQRTLTVKVAVSRPGVTVRANKRTIVPGVAAEPVSIDAALRNRIAQGGVAFGVPIALATALRRDPSGDSLQLAINVEVPARVTPPLAAMFSVINSQGRTVQAGRHVIASPASSETYRIAFPVSLTLGDYRLRFAVADGHGNIGSVEHQVAAHLSRFGTVSASDLLVGWSASDGQPRFLALERLPPESTKLRASLELYPDPVTDSPVSLEVRFALLRAGTAEPVVQEFVRPSGNARVVTAAAEISPTILEPGTYTIRATILQAGKPIGSVAATFTKTS
jgi:VWFA-related protein